MPDSEQPQAPASWPAFVDRVRGALPGRLTSPMGLGLALATVVVVAALAGAAWFILRGSPAPVPIDLPRAGAPAGTGDGAPASASLGESGATGVTITVAAGGAVTHPGVYVVPSKARVADVIAAAGGTLDEADLDQLNLAAKVADADRVFVPRKGQPVPPVAGPGPGASTGSGSGAGPPGTANSPVDLNTATLEQLDALPGVGPATAQAILSYRSTHGRFKSVNELLEVRGIGPAKFEALRTLVRVV